MTDLLLVFPNNRQRAYGELASDVAGINVPVQLGLTAAFVRRLGFSVEVLDADAENLTADEAATRAAITKPLLTLVSSDSLNSGDVTKMAAASETLRAIRRIAPDVRTAVEGVAPSAFPEQMLREEAADFACQGEAFQQIAELVKALKAGKRYPDDPIRGMWWMDGDTLVTSTRPDPIGDPDTLPFIAWDLLPMDKYRAHHWHCLDDISRRKPYASIYTNLGCPYACTFCTVNAVVGKPNFRPRTAANVVDEIDLLVHRYKVRNIRIVDNVFTIRLDLVEELCYLLISRGYDLNMWAYARVETIKSLDLLKKMKKAGINWLAYGIEAASEKVRGAVAKKSPEQTIERAIELTRQADINMVGNFIFGLPEDDQNSMQQTFDMAKKYLFEYGNFYAAMAYPGTELHEQAKRDGIELPRTWSGYGQYSWDALPLSTNHLSAAEVLRFRDWAFEEYHTYEPYRKMVAKRFGQQALDYIDQILKVKLRRKILAG